MSYYSVCVKSPDLIDEFHKSDLVPSLVDYINVIENCNKDIISRMLERYSDSPDLKIAVNMTYGIPLVVTNDVALLNIQYGMLDSLHEYIRENIVLKSYPGPNFLEYTKKYPDDNIKIRNSASCEDDQVILSLLSSDRIKEFDLKDLADMTNVPLTVGYVFENMSYDVHDMIECMENNNMQYLYPKLDMTRFKFRRCLSKNKVLESNIKYKFIDDSDIMREYFEQSEYKDLYLRSIQDKNICVRLKLRRKYDIELLRKCIDFGITNVTLVVHYDDEVVGKGTPCPMFKLLSLMDDIPSKHFIVNIVRPKYIDNLVRVLDRYQYEIIADNIAIYHGGIMEARYNISIRDC